jgi:hypothetical protein
MSEKIIILLYKTPDNDYFKTMINPQGEVYNF